MNTTTQTNDTKIFSAMVEILTSSILGEKEYGFSEDIEQTTYGELASVMNQKGFSNRAGEPLNRNTLKQIVHRVSKNKVLFESFRPDWDKFRDTHSTQETTSNNHKNGCLVCGSVVHNKDKKLCSSDCVKVYQEHKDAPHDSKFPTIFHQIQYEESFSKLN